MNELLFLLTTFGALFSVVNPFGSMPVFISLTTENTLIERKRFALKTSVYVFVILLISFLIGKYILLFFGIGITSLRLAGGLIIALSGFALLTGKITQHKGMNRAVKDDAQEKDDPSLTPLAMPMLAGPGSISYMITMNESNSNIIYESLAVFAAFMLGLSIFLILRSSNYIFNKMGASGLISLSRVIGFIVMAIGIEYMLASVYEIAQNILA